MTALRPCGDTCDAMIPWSMARCEDCERDMDRSGAPPGPRHLTTTDDFDRQCERYQINCLYHLTHIDNLPSIRNFGLLSHNRAHDQTDPRDIANQEVIARRSETSRHRLQAALARLRAPLLHAHESDAVRQAGYPVGAGHPLHQQERAPVRWSGLHGWQRRQRPHAVFRRLPAPRPARLGVYQSAVLDRLSGRNA